MRQGITTRQAIVVISEALGWPVSIGKLQRVMGELDKDGRLSDDHANTGMLYPEDVDELSGELWRMRAGWYQRRNVKGDMSAWVMAKLGVWRLLRIPYARTWLSQAEREKDELPDEVVVYAWPTGEPVGKLLRVEDRDGVLAYVDAALYTRSKLRLHRAVESPAADEN
jgi:hypothetical protein